MDGCGLPQESRVGYTGVCAQCTVRVRMYSTVQYRNVQYVAVAVKSKLLNKIKIKDVLEKMLLFTSARYCSVKIAHL